MMKYCVAIDGGGTKTEVVLFDETGHILKHHIGVGGNPTDVGIEEAQLRLKRCLSHAVSDTHMIISSLYGGIAGVLPNGDIFSDLISQSYLIGSIRIEDDGCNIISGTLGHADGCGMVCGTGSSLFVRIDGQPLRHIGGKGYLIDTGGSGFELGKEAICMAMRAVDGRCKKTILTQLLEEALGQPVTDAIIPMVHRGGRSYIASFASAVFAGRKLGDWACEDIFQRSASLMADLVWAAQQYFDTTFTVVMGGGIIAHYPEYAKAIQEKAPVNATLVLQSAPPIMGAAVEAMWDAGVVVTDNVRTRFLEDYHKIKTV